VTLQAVLWLKIGVTAAFWALPLLFAPVRLFRRLGFPAPVPMVFVRLLGAAFAALLVGYVDGVLALRAGRHPAGTVWMGLLSNAAACVLIVLYGFMGAYAGWGRRARVYMGASALATGLVTAGLLAYGRAPEVREAPRAGLTIPVAGVRAAELKDTYGDPRSGGRAHKGVDIFAAEGTPVLAADAGVVVQRDSGGAGGIALYQRGLDGRTIYYYAHLSGYRAGLKVGDLVRAGDTLGYVGSTGNVSGSPHLHFAVFTVTDPNRWARGRDLNPYVLLRP
jgi:hypothetical protein